MINYCICLNLCLECSDNLPVEGAAHFTEDDFVVYNFTTDDAICHFNFFQAIVFNIFNRSSVSGMD